MLTPYWIEVSIVSWDDKWVRRMCTAEKLWDADASA